MPNCPGSPPTCPEGKSPLCFGLPGAGIPYSWTCQGTQENYPRDPGQKTCPEGWTWNTSTQKCQAPAGGSPPPEAGGLGPSPCAGLTGAALWACRSRNQPQTVTRMVPQTLTDLLSRFYTNDFSNYLNTGALGAGVPQAEGSLLDLLLNSSFQNLLSGLSQPAGGTARGGGMWGPSPPIPVGDQGKGGIRGPQPPLPATGTAAANPLSVLGLSGGAAAYGYIDPSWMFDRSQRTVWNPVTEILAGGGSQKPNVLPMNGLVASIGKKTNPCVGLTGQALWACRGGRERERSPRVA